MEQNEIKLNQLEINKRPAEKERIESQIDQIISDPEESQIGRFSVFNQFLAINYNYKGLIIIIDIKENQILYIVDDPNIKFNINQ